MGGSPPPGVGSMTVAVNLPEDIARRLEASWQDGSRGALQAIAVEGYRSGALTRGRVGELLDLSFIETEAFLKARQAFLPYDEQDLDQDLDDIERLRPQ
jgi:predicted HTH domain antitoxin